MLIFEYIEGYRPILNLEILNLAPFARRARALAVAAMRCMLLSYPAAPRPS
jgi:hypothetical protein